MQPSAGLQVKLVGVVFVVFLITLVMSTIVLLTSINDFGERAVYGHMDSEKIIIGQNLENVQQDLLEAASLIANHPELIDVTVDNSDGMLVINMENFSESSDYEIVTLSFDTTQNPSQFDGSEVYARLKRKALQGESAIGLLPLQNDLMLTAVVPMNMGDGIITISERIDSHLLGELNFGRSDSALVIFPVYSLAGISANEADGQPHLNAEQVESLRLNDEQLRRIQLNETIQLSGIVVKGTPHTAYYEPLIIGGELAGYYTIALDEAQQNAVQNQIAAISALTVLGISILVTVLLTYGLHRLVIAPLHHIGHAAQKLAKGQLDARVAELSSDEIGQLGGVFNLMASNIETRTQELDALNQTLELRIEERTNEVQQQAKRLETVLRSANEAIIVTDSNKLVQLINDTALDVIGHPENVVLNMSLDDMLTSYANQNLEWPDDNMSQGEIDISDNHYRYSISSLGDSNEGYVCVFADITPLKRLDTLKTTMIQMAAHDLRSPITALNLQTHMLKTDPNRLSERQLRVLEKMNATVQDLQNMVTNMLDIDRIEKQAKGMHEQVHMDALITSAISLLRDNILDKRQHLQVDISEDLPMVCGDPVQLLEVIRNYLTNAIKYTDRDGSIKICAYQRENNLVIEVKDNGIGISKSDLPYIFESNFRAKTALQSQEEGKGVGLSLVKRVIEEHNGRVWVESTEALGSTFGIEIPVDPSCIVEYEL